MPEGQHSDTGQANDSGWIHTTSDLDSHREKITRLYQAENRKLSDVMTIMLNQAGCKATPNMYKKKIRSWGIDKRKKHEEMVNLQQAIQQQKNQGGKSEPQVIRGRLVGEADIAQYFSRRKQYLERKRRARRDQSVIVEPEPPWGEQGIDETSREDGSSWFNASTWYGDSNIKSSQYWYSLALDKWPPTTPTLPRGPTLPEIYSAPNDFFRLVDLHQSQILKPLILPPSAFDGTADETDENIQAIESLRAAIAGGLSMDTLWNSVVTGTGLLNEGKIPMAMAVLNQGFRQIHGALLHRTPGSLTSISLIMLTALQAGHPAIARLLAELVHVQVNFLFGPQDILTQLTHLLHQRWDSVEMLEFGVQANCTSTTSLFGKYDYWNLALLAALLEGRVGLGDLSFKEVNSRFEDLLRTCEEAQRLIPARYNMKAHLNGIRQYAMHLAANGQYTRAESLRSDFPEKVCQGLPSRPANEEALCGLEELSDILIIQGRYQEAEIFLKEGSHRPRELLGDDDSVTLHLKYLLGKLARVHGKHGDAAQYYNELSGLLEQF